VTLVHLLRLLIYRSVPYTANRSDTPQQPPNINKPKRSKFEKIPKRKFIIKMEVINQKEDEDHPRAIEDNDNAVDTEDGALYGEEENEEEEDALENEEEEEEEEEGESDTVDEDQFRFCGGVNPMDFVRNSNPSVQLYQKLEDYHQKSIEYRALDNRKRKPPQQPHR